jgi:transposase
MKFVGIDLHKKTIVLCIVDHQKKVLQRARFLCAEPDRIHKFFAQLGLFQAVVEATASYEWLVALLEPLAQRIVLAHPGKLRVIAESVNKSDKLDAKVLAEFLALDLIPASYRPTPREREHRVLVRHRVSMRRRLSQLKVKIRRVLANYNADRRDLFTLVGRAYLGQVQLSAADRFVLDQFLSAFDHAQQQLRDAAARLRQFAKQAPARDQEARALLKSAPGVGEVTAEVVLSELGDWSRFRAGKQVIAYSGLAPGRRESAGKARDLGISKQGSSLLRWIMVQAAWRAVRHSLKWQAVYEQIGKRRGKRKAIVAVARRLLSVLFALLRTGQAYRYGIHEKPRLAVPAQAKEAAETLE